MRKRPIFKKPCIYHIFTSQITWATTVKYKTPILKSPSCDSRCIQSDIGHENEDGRIGRTETMDQVCRQLPLDPATATSPSQIILWLTDKCEHTPQTYWIIYFVHCSSKTQNCHNSSFSFISILNDLLYFWCWMKLWEVLGWGSDRFNLKSPTFSCQMSLTRLKTQLKI